MDSHPDDALIEDEKPASMTSQVYDRLRRDILTGVLEPGAKLKIERLRDRYSAGASPLREALSLLTSERLVDRMDQRGFSVADISVADFEELLKTRCWLEERAAMESIRNATTRWEEGLVLAHHRLSRMKRTSGPGLETTIAWEAAHKRFHMALLSACGSQPLMDFCEQLYDRNIRYRYIAVTSAYPRRDVTQEHREIFEAAVARDAERTTTLLLQHYQGTGEFLKQALRELEPA